MSDHNEAMSQLPHKLATLIKCLPQAPFRDHLAAECIKQAERIVELEARVHTCGPTCSKAGCINRRFTAELKSARAETNRIIALLDAANDERKALRAEVESLRVDAERYRWLRSAHWSDAPLCCVLEPKANVRLGATCPSGDQLDTAIDTARKEAT